MKRIITLLLLFLLLQIKVNAQDEDYIYYRIEKLPIGSVQHLLFDSVNLRAEPDASSKLIGIMPIGSALKISSISDETLTIKGLTHHWYEVQKLTKSLEETEIKGYIWGGLFADFVKVSPTDSAIKIFAGLSEYIYTEPEEEDRELYYEYHFGDTALMQIRMVKNGITLDRIDFPTIGALLSPLDFEITGNKGLKLIDDIILLRFDESKCAGAFGKIYLFRDKNTLKLVSRLYEGFDAPLFHDQIYIFPNDKGGKSDTIVHKNECGYYYDKNDIEYEFRKYYEYIWDGDTLIQTKADEWINEELFSEE